jgi:DNA-binding NarL/FixJ family response regulator
VEDRAGSHSSRIPEQKPNVNASTRARTAGIIARMSPSPVHALLDDLFFRSRIEATAEAAGVRVIVSRTLAGLEDSLDEAGGTGVLVDLGLGTDAAAHAIGALKRRVDPPHVIAWGSHVDDAALSAARDAGADRVLARSAFTRKLPDLLRQLAG